MFSQYAYVKHVTPRTGPCLVPGAKFEQTCNFEQNILLFLFCLVFAMSLCASVYMCFVVTCWERDLLALVCRVCHFPISTLGQVRYLIVSIPDLCTLTYFGSGLPADATYKISRF